MWSKSISCLLMPWRCLSPGHQQAWYWAQLADAAHNGLINLTCKSQHKRPTASLVPRHLIGPNYIMTRLTHSLLCYDTPRSVFNTAKKIISITIIQLQNSQITLKYSSSFLVLWIFFINWDIWYKPLATIHHKVCDTTVTPGAVWAMNVTNINSEPQNFSSISYGIIDAIVTCLFTCSIS